MELSSFSLFPGLFCLFLDALLQHVSNICCRHVKKKEKQFNSDFCYGLKNLDFFTLQNTITLDRKYMILFQNDTQINIFRVLTYPSISLYFHKREKQLINQTCKSTQNRFFGLPYHRCLLIFQCFVSFLTTCFFLPKSISYFCPHLKKLQSNTMINCSHLLENRSPMKNWVIP